MSHTKIDLKQEMIGSAALWINEKYYGFESPDDYLHIEEMESSSKYMYYLEVQPRYEDEKEPTFICILSERENSLALHDIIAVRSNDWKATVKLSNGAEMRIIKFYED